MWFRLNYSSHIPVTQTLNMNFAEPVTLSLRCKSITTADGCWRCCGDDDDGDITLEVLAIGSESNSFCCVAKCCDKSIFSTSEWLTSDFWLLTSLQNQLEPANYHVCHSTNENFHYCKSAISLIVEFQRDKFYLTNWYFEKTGTFRIFSVII